MKTAGRRKVAADGHGLVSKKKNVIFAKEFSGNRDLKSIVIGSWITKLGIRAFSGCSSLASVQLEEGLLEIGAYCFAGCEALEDLIIPDSVQNVYSFAFSECVGLKTPVYNRSGSVLYRYPDNLEGAVCRIRPGVLKIASTAFANNPYLQEVILPDSVTELDFRAFYESGIRSVTVPAGVKAIRPDTFVRCETLEEVHLLGETRVEPNAFRGASRKLKIFRKGKPVRANEKFWAIGKPLLQEDRCPLPARKPDLEDPRFLDLAEGCVRGNPTSMWEMGDYFAKKYEQHADLFYHRAETFWRYFAYLTGESRADNWFGQWEAANPDSRLPALLDESRSGMAMDGSYLAYLGFTFFEPGVRYDVLPTDAFGITLIQSYPHGGNSFESGHYCIACLDEYLNPLPGATIYRHPDYWTDLNSGNPLLATLKEKAEKTALMRNWEKRKNNPYIKNSMINTGVMR